MRGAITSSRSVSETLRRLGRPDNSWQRGALRRWAAEANISMSHFLGQAHQRGGPGTTPLRPAEEILVRTENGRRTGSHLLRRALRGIGIPEQCAECGTGTTWHGRPLTLEVDHINADWSDNRPDNLRLLCPNCHAVTRTWCRGRARARPR
ncbi:conserved hypothetical protein [Streptomyces clavuligerus]|nr:conserved hypothetical protein [Streptomyces clavuligerus]